MAFKSTVAAKILGHTGTYFCQQAVLLLLQRVSRWDVWLADNDYAVFDTNYRLSPPARWQQAPDDIRCAIG